MVQSLTRQQNYLLDTRRPNQQVGCFLLLSVFFFHLFFLYLALFRLFFSIIHLFFIQSGYLTNITQFIFLMNEIGTQHVTLSQKKWPPLSSENDKFLQHIPNLLMHIRITTNYILETSEMKNNNTISCITQINYY